MEDKKNVKGGICHIPENEKIYNREKSKRELIRMDWNKKEEMYARPDGF